MNKKYQTELTRTVGIQYPIICGPMYPCSNPELVAAVSKEGGLGVIQPVSMEFVHRVSLEESLRQIRKVTDKPLGLNALIEASSKAYEDRVRKWIQIALDHGIRFFITSLGNPKWVVDMVKPEGGLVYHDVIHRKHALKAKSVGVDGLIAVNNRAGGHAGDTSVEDLYRELVDLGLPIICAGGVASPARFKAALDLGYAGVQMGTRFIATVECTAHEAYKKKIVEAREADIVKTERVTGVPLSVIKTPYIEKIGTRAGPIARWMLKGRKTKKIMRVIYFLRSGWSIRRSTYRATATKDYLQAGKSVEDIHSVVPVKKVMQDFAAVLNEST